MDNFELIEEKIVLQAIIEDDVDALFEAVQEKEIWVHLKDRIESREDAEKYVQEALALKLTGSAYPFIIVHRSTNKVIGSTRFMMIELSHKRLSGNRN